MTEVKRILAVILGLAVLSATSAEAGYIDAVNALNPIRYYRFEDASTASGAVMADTAGVDSATYGASASSLTGPAIGVANSAVGGGGARIGTGTVTADLPAQNADRTLMYWFRQNSATGYNPLVGYGIANHFESYFAGGKVRSGITGKNEPVSADADLNTWYFAAITIGETGTDDWRLYLAKQGDAAVSLVSGPNTVGTGDGTNNGPMFIGSATDADFDEVALFNTALSEAQINSVWGQAVPEPVSLVLVGIASLMMALRRTKR